MTTRGLLCGFILSDWIVFPGVGTDWLSVPGDKLPTDSVSSTLGSLTESLGRALPAGVLVWKLAVLVVVTVAGVGAGDVEALTGDVVAGVVTERISLS